MCYYSGRLYIVEKVMVPKGNMSYRLAVYSVADENNIALLDTLALKGPVWQPRVDHHSGQVYIPCQPHGVCVVRYDGSKLIAVTTLRSLKKPARLAVLSTDTLCVCENQGTLSLS